VTDGVDPALNLERMGFGRPGFAEAYDAVRPAPPAELLDLLCRYARVERPRLVVDLGCGTGLSTEPWLERAERVVGIEPLPEMLAVARRRLAAPNVELVQAYGHETGLPDGCADVVSCTQSFHWMDPGPTLEEVARVLRPGAVFAAVDYDGPASIDWEVERAAIRFREEARRLRRELEVHEGADEAHAWAKEGHLAAIEATGRFAYVKEALLHRVESVSAERYVQWTINQVVDYLEALHERGVTDDELGLTELRATAERIVGREGRCFVGYRVRLGVRSPSDPAPAA
jgi:SAM-dependent methyltransferase